MVVPSSGLRQHSYYCLVTWRPRRQAHLSLGKKRDDFPWQSAAQPGASSSSRVGVKPGAKGLTCPAVGKPGHSTEAVHYQECGCCREVPQQERLEPARHPGGAVTPRQLLFLLGKTLVSISNPIRYVCYDQFSLKKSVSRTKSLTHPHPLIMYPHKQRLPLSLVWHRWACNSSPLMVKYTADVCSFSGVPGFQFLL